MIRVSRCIVALCSFIIASPVCASEEAQSLLDAYDKRDLIEMLLDRCYGEITTNEPFPKRVYGRPPADRVDARTLAEDMKRCKFSAADAEADLAAKGVQHIRREGERVVKGSSHSGVSSSPGGGSRGRSLQSRVRELERKERAQERKAQRRREKGQRELEKERQRSRSAKQREQDRRDRECASAKELRDSYRSMATDSKSVAARQAYRERAQELQEAVRSNCKSVL